MTNTQREAMQQALDALREIAWSNDSKWQSDRAQSITEPLRAALAEPVGEPVGWPAGSAELHASLLQMGKSMAKERSREIGDAWNQLADLLALLAKASRTSSPPQPVEVPLLSDDEIYEMYSEPRSDAEMLAFGREVEQIVRKKVGIK